MFYALSDPAKTMQYQEGGRSLLLRRSQVEDAAVIVEAVTESLAELRAFMPWAHFDGAESLADQQERLEGASTLWDEGKDFVYHCFEPQADGELQFVGCVGLHPRCLNNMGLEVGYWIRTSAAGRGLCTLATKMAVWGGFHALGLERIQVGCDVANVASARVAEKVGFVYEGLLRKMVHGKAPQAIEAQGWKGTGDMKLYALTREDLPSLAWTQALSEGMTLDGA